MFKRILHTDNAETTILIRIMVGAVFLSEGIFENGLLEPLLYLI